MTRKELLLLGFFIVSGITTDHVFGLGFHKFYITDSILNNYSGKNIRTVLLHQQGSEFTVPVIVLNSDQKLELHFDDISGETHHYSYTLVHCDATWKKSDLSEQEYLSGYGSGRIQDAQSSFNTTFDYRHFRHEFPQEECMPVAGGNYVIMVYDEEDPENIVLIRRFFVTDQTVRASVTVKQPSTGPGRENSHQVQFTVNYDAGEIRDPLKEITAVVVQNNRYDRQMVFDRPYAFHPGKLEYNGPETGIITAGNEFRSLDIKSMKYQSQNIAAIDFQNPYYHVFLKPDEDRSGKPWFSNRDLNGSYYIDAEKSDDRHTQADYVYVHFNLVLPQTYPDQQVYVSGGFNDWRHDQESRMIPGQDGSYTLTLLLKQGLYDYCYMQNDGEKGQISETGIEGSFYETENTYSIFVYFHDQFKGYDRLIGFTSTK